MTNERTIISKSHLLLVMPTVTICLIKFIEIKKSVPLVQVKAPRSVKFYAEIELEFYVFFCCQECFDLTLNREVCY